MDSQTFEVPRGAEKAADVIVAVVNAIGRGLDAIWHFFGNTYDSTKPLDHCKTTEDVILYAQSIQSKQPSFAADLMAAAKRSEE